MKTTADKRKVKWHVALLRRVLDRLCRDALVAGREEWSPHRTEGAYSAYVARGRKVSWNCIAFCELKRQIESLEFAIEQLEITNETHKNTK